VVDFAFRIRLREVLGKNIYIPLTCTQITNVNKIVGFEVLKAVTMNSNILLGHDAL
jgi:hypothetical protein